MWLYAGLAFQLLAALGVAVWAGIRLDRWMVAKVPLMVWILPLLVIIAVIVKVIKDTERKSKGEK
ncbi:hypothetical protein FLA_4500 [Filimonas lacunae]|nr:hypothetical protein FLA_4500 [Filimonas lacunae]